MRRDSRELEGSRVGKEGRKECFGAGGLKGIAGMPLEEVETPALIVDLDVMEANMDMMLAFLRQGTGKGSVGIRPHAKSHKTPEIAKMQMAKGALGICCAKLGEAEAMADGGLPDIMLTSEIIGEAKVRRLAALSKRCDLKVAVDAKQNLLDISATSAADGGRVGVVIETEVGNNRCGIRTHAEAVEIARLASTLPGVWYAGIMGYEGHAVFMPDFEERKAAASKAYDLLLGFRDAIKKDAGLDSGIVSTGGTGTYLFGGRREGITDIEAGSYIFMDTRYGSTAGVDFMNSLAVLATIVSNPEKDLYVSDAGLKSMTREFGMVSTLPSYGLKVDHMSEEHISLRPDASPDNLPGYRELDRRYAANAGKTRGRGHASHAGGASHVPDACDVRHVADTGRSFKVGDKILLIPSHCCTTVNLHDVIYAIRDGEVEDVWRVAGRGRFV